MCSTNTAPIIFEREKLEVGIERYVRQANRLYNVMDLHLADREWFAAGEYTIADMAVYPWLRMPAFHGVEIDEYPERQALARHGSRERPAVLRALEVLKSEQPLRQAYRRGMGPSVRRDPIRSAATHTGNIVLEDVCMADQIVITAEPLRAFTAEIFRKAGLADEQAAVTADVLVWADLRGHPSHGVMAHPALYRLDRQRADQCQGARPKVVLRKGAVAKIDGEGAIGPAAMAPAVDAAIAQAREHAAAWVLVQDHTHAGAIGFYADARGSGRHGGDRHVGAAADDGLSRHPRRRRFHQSDRHRHAGRHHARHVDVGELARQAHGRQGHRQAAAVRHRARPATDAPRLTRTPP